MELPVVVTDAGGVPELVRNGKEGLLVPPGQPEALADAIESLLCDRTRSEALGKAGRRRVVECFSSRRSAEMIAEQLGKLGNTGVDLQELPRQCKRIGHLA
jgi:glycosyltransferase involved in cell wall biosynthesis